MIARPGRMNAGGRTADAPPEKGHGRLDVFPVRTPAHPRVHLSPSKRLFSCAHRASFAAFGYAEQGRSYLPPVVSGLVVSSWVERRKNARRHRSKKKQCAAQARRSYGENMPGLRMAAMNVGPLTCDKNLLVAFAPGRVDIPTTSVIIEHPKHGFVLWDTGINEAVADPERGEAYWGADVRTAFGPHAFTRSHVVDRS